MNLLIVDDSPTCLMLLRGQLEGVGHSVFEARDGVEALAVLERQRVDVVITDILMPRMDGYRLCFEIRKHALLGNLPIIFHTSTYTTPDDEKLALDVGADKYIKKPASVETLVAALREVVAKPNAGSRAETLPEIEVLKEYSERLVSKLEQKNTELAAAEAKFRALVEQSLVGIYVIQDGRFAYVNPKMAEIFGFSEMELTSAPVTDFILEEDRPLALENIRKRMAGEIESTHYRLAMLRKDGRVIHAEVHGGRTEYNGRPAILGTLLDVTERQRAEAAMRQSEARYRTLFDYAPDGILIADSESYYTDANASICRMLGYTRDELIGLHASDIVAPTEFQHIEPALGAIKARSDHHREWRFRRKDGSTFDAEVTATMMPDGNLMGVIRDITERKKAELALREKELLLHAADRRLAEIIHGMTEACFALDTEWRFTFVNDRGGTLLRHDRNEMLGRSIWEVFHKLVGTPMEAHYRRAMTERVPVAFEAFSPIAERWLDIRLFPTTEGLAAFLLDIDARKQAEASQREGEERFRTMANSIPQLAWIARADGFIFWYNERWYEYTGTTPEQMEGWGGQSLHDPEVLPKVMERWKDAIDSGKPFEMEFPLRGANGRFRTFLTRVQPLRNSEGRVVQWFGTNTDVEALREANERLEFKVAERTAELRAAKERAESSDRLKSEFLANMSHELRTPLNGIIGFTEFLVDGKPGPLNPKQAEYLGDVLNSARHLLQLINDVLDLAKVEAGKMDFYAETFPLARAIEEACAVVNGFANKKRVSLAWSVAPELASVTLDQQKLKQVCYNLLSNAVKFTNSQGSVELTALGRDADHFELRVKDTGIGIKRDDLQRLFREFEQLDTGKSRRFEGTGLGLVLTKKIVELQCGTISVESEYGKGSTFTVVLPTAMTEVKSNE